MDLPAPEGPDITIGRYFWFAVVCVSRGLVPIGVKGYLRVGAIVVEWGVRRSVEQDREATVGTKNRAGAFAGRRSMRGCCRVGGFVASERASGLRWQNKKAV